MAKFYKLLFHDALYRHCKMYLICLHKHHFAFQVSVIPWSSVGVPLWHGHLCPKSSQWAPHDLPVRARYGVSIVSFQSDLYRATDIVVLNEIPCYIGLCYDNTQLLSTIEWQWILTLLLWFARAWILIIIHGAPTCWRTPMCMMLTQLKRNWLFRCRYLNAFAVTLLSMFVHLWMYVANKLDPRLPHMKSSWNFRFASPGFDDGL